MYVMDFFKYFYVDTRVIALVQVGSAGPPWWTLLDVAAISLARRPG